MKTEASFRNGREDQSRNRLRLFVGALLWLEMVVVNLQAETYATWNIFGGNKSLPQSTLAAASDGWIYGTTSGKVTGSGATVFKFPSFSPSWYETLKFFTQAEGITVGPVTLSGTTIYGVAYAGGVSNLGTLYRLNTDGTGFSVIKHFTNSAGEGANPWGGMALSGATLYGTTVNGGSRGGGVLFSVNTNGDGFTVLKHFADSDGANPEGSLVLSGTNLYGTTINGGGTVFKINTNGGGFTVLKRFQAVTWEGPRSGLVLSGTTLYGTISGGPSTHGLIFKLREDGSNYVVLKQFNNADGSMPRGDLVLTGEALFGTTSSGGQYGDGTVFMMNLNGDGHTILHHFGTSDYDGVSPRGGMVLVGGTLFGTTYVGGAQWDGILFKVVPPAPPTIQGPPKTQTAEIGAAVCLDVQATGSPPISYQWYFNDTNAIRELTTNSWLRLTNLQPDQCGVYSVMVSNWLWAVTSAPAMLNLIPPVERRPAAVIHLEGTAGSVMQLDYSDALGEDPGWLPLDEVSLISTSEVYFDLSAPLPPQRFYRAWQTGGPSVVPILSLSGVVPAITLKGAIGNSLRVDGINQFGPTDAWVTLDTVTLTNTSQLYFDLSAWGQPQRLYRLVPVP